MPLPTAFKGERWSNITARRIFPLLVWCAEHDRKITYGQLDAELVRRGWSHHVFIPVYGYAAGTVGDALLETEAEWGQPIPPLNALVVNANTAIPGKGCDYYLSKYFTEKPRSKLSKHQRKAIAEETIEEIWRFPKWQEVLRAYGLKPIRGGIPSLKLSDKVERPKRGGWSSAPESKRHKALKEWVAQHPEILKLKSLLPKGQCERLFASADRADVFFQGKKLSVVAEVKAQNANDADLNRGIFQCVKYQALIRAELKAQEKIPSGFAFLVTERELTLPAQNLADLLGVQVVVVKNWKGA